MPFSDEVFLHIEVLHSLCGGILAPINTGHIVIVEERGVLGITEGEIVENIVQMD